jgi:hypothetical protein
MELTVRFRKIDCGFESVWFLLIGQVHIETENYL